MTDKPQSRYRSRELILILFAVLLFCLSWLKYVLNLNNVETILAVTAVTVFILLYSGMGRWLFRVFSDMGWRLYRVRRQQESVAKILKLGGNTNFQSRGIIDFFALERVSFVTVGGKRMGDEDMRAVKEFYDLHSLFLPENEITDEGLAQLTGLAKLWVLDLKHNRQITDAGLIHLARLANLNTLVLVGTQVTDEGVEKLEEELPNCTIIH